MCVHARLWICLSVFVCVCGYANVCVSVCVCGGVCRCAVWLCQIQYWWKPHFRASLQHTIVYPIVCGCWFPEVVLCWPMPLVASCGSYLKASQGWPCCRRHRQLLCHHSPIPCHTQRCARGLWKWVSRLLPLSPPSHPSLDLGCFVVVFCLCSMVLGLFFSLYALCWCCMN